MKTTLTNMRRFELDQGVRIDRLSEFGNPFRIGKDGGRETVIAKYRDYFYKRIATDKQFYFNVQALRGKKLACWCTPLPCHGDIIIEYLEKTKDECRVAPADGEESV